MSPLALAWIVSIAGAALFFAAGALAARGRRHDAVPAVAGAAPLSSDPATIALRTALDRMAVQRDRLEADGEQARSKIAELEAAARRAMAAQRDAEQARDAARDDASRSAAAGIGDRDRIIAGLEAAVGERDRRIAELDARSAALDAVIAQRDGELVEARTRARRADDALQLARGEVERESRRVAELEGAATNSDGAGRTQELVLALEAARARAADADGLRDEIARLTVAASRTSGLIVKVAELETEVSNLRARDYARPKPPAAPIVLRSGDSTENALRSALARLVGPGGVRSAVIADELGLAVAAVGEHEAALAAFGAFLCGVGRKARDHLPLGGLRTIAVEDENGTAVRVTAGGADPHLVVVALAAGPGPAPSSARRALDEACAAVAAPAA